MTYERLAVIEKIESFLKKKGFQGCRFRLSEQTATVELTKGDIPQFITSKTYIELLAIVEASGISKVMLDLKERPGASVDLE